MWRILLVRSSTLEDLLEDQKSNPQMSCHGISEGWIIKSLHKILVFALGSGNISFSSLRWILSLFFRLNLPFSNFFKILKNPAIPRGIPQI